MFRRSTMSFLILMAVVLCAVPLSADEALEKAFEALKAYEFGQDRSALQPIDQAVAASHGDATARTALEARLAAVLATSAPQAAKDFVCRQLSVVGTAASVPAVAPLLADEKLSHMARYALERIPGAEAIQSLRDGLAKAGGLQKVGIINSLAVRRDAGSTATFVALLQADDKQVASAAAAALGAVGNSEAAKALDEYQAKAPEDLRLAAADAYLACAERLLADGKKAGAMNIYKALSKPDQPKHVRLAATRGLLAVAGQK